MKYNRREFIVAAPVGAVALITSGAPSLGNYAGLSCTLATRLAAMRGALAVLEAASQSQEAFWQSCETIGLIEQDAFWDWYQVQPVRMAYRQALENALHTVEAAFMATTTSSADEEVVMDALSAYEQIAPSAFAMQCARDLFTPQRFQTYPLSRMREALLSDPDECFAKSPVPGFLHRMRADHRAQFGV